MSGAVHSLAGQQRDAVDPQESVWLSASAGTGKTQVLSARVLRLLLEEGNDPSQILCLTFTKAGAAEMAVRVKQVLARWVRMPDIDLADELQAIGARTNPATIARARALFANVLDSPGGGLRIDTIHAFAQWLLSAFPLESGIAPGSRAMEDRDRDLLSREVLGEMLVNAEQEGDHATLDAIAQFSRRKGPDAVRTWLMRCACAADLWEGPAHWQPPMRPRVCALLGLGADASVADAAALCTDEEFDVASLRQCLAIFAAWDTKTGQAGAAAIHEWLDQDAMGRLETLDSFFGSVMTAKGDPMQIVAKRDTAYKAQIGRVKESIERARDLMGLITLADFLAPSFEVGRKFSLLWADAKKQEGYVDFDDQIQHAAALLRNSDMADWIRYKLDRRFDHILIDEAQDTNEEQWDIIFALIDDFFSGEGAHDNKLRTLFTVGDYKQAIFRFQGTSPENFEIARNRVKSLMEYAVQNVVQTRSNYDARSLKEYGLGQSFRTARPVLDFVDAAIEELGWKTFGLKTDPGKHSGDDRPGLVTLWNVVSETDGDDGAEEEADEGWLGRHDRLMADKIARQVRQWMDQGFPLVKGKARNAAPGDVMVLVRKRKELAGLIVARLYAAGVPVAGVDRLRLGNPLAVKDLMAALNFAAQPLDDLSLANILVSPLIGWSQEQLLEWAYRPKGVRLWDHLRKSDNPDMAQTADQLRDLIGLADYETPQALLHWILAGPWQGRRKLVARLGREANDPINELLNAAHVYASAHTASLHGFIRWMAAGEGELKREAGENADLVRVMTVHGSKGLQSPIVILADAAGKPGSTSDLTLIETLPGAGAPRKVPLPGLTRAEMKGPIIAAQELAVEEEMQEHWRLLYVAMTRAEEALFIGGSLGVRERKKGPSPDSWYARIKPLFKEMPLEDDIWGGRWEWGARADDIAIAAPAANHGSTPLPHWAITPIGPEPRPPRPLAPSAAGGEQGADPPLPPEAARDAARRGVLIHALLERLPDVAVDARADAARTWLARQAPDLETAMLEEMLQSALSILQTPEFAEIFSDAALAEVPLAAIVDGQVIAGTADRLLITPNKITVVDFKTARRPPANLGEIPQSTLRQMGAYAAALAEIYPDHTVCAAVLYTQTPILLPIPAEILAQHKPRLSTAQESFSRSLLE